MNWDDKPTAESIESLRRHLMKVWGDTWGDWEELDSYYFQNFNLWPAAMTGRPVYHPARSRQIVDAAVDHQMGFDPLIHRYPAGEGETHKKKANGVELYLKAAFEETSLLEPALTAKAVSKNLIHLGYGIIEGPLLDRSDRPQKPARGRGESEDDYASRLVLYENEKKTWMPFRIRVPHPARVLMDPTEKNPSFAVKHAVRFSHQLHAMTSQRKNRRRDVDLWEMGEDPWELIMCDEFWTKTWHAVIANSGVSGASGNRSKSGDPLRALIVEKNTWGFVPYAHAFSGWGQPPTSEDQNNPRYLASGILTPILESLKLQAQAVSGRHNALMEATFNVRGTTMDPADLQGQLAKGDIAAIPDKSAVWWMDIPNLPGWMFESEKWLDRDIELGTMSRSLAGQHQTGVNTLGEAISLSSAAARKFVGVNKQLEHLYTTVAGNMLRLVDVLGETLYCRGHTIRPNDIEHDYSVQISFDVTDLPLQLQMQELGMREMKEGAKSLETYLEKDARNEDVTGEVKRILHDDVRRHPAVHEYLAMLAAKEMGLGDILERQLNPGGRQPGQGNGAGAEPPGLMGPDGLPVLGGSMGQPPVNGPPMNGPLGGPPGGPPGMTGMPTL